MRSIECPQRTPELKRVSMARLMERTFYPPGTAGQARSGAVCASSPPSPVRQVDAPDRRGLRTECVSLGKGTSTLK
jgi:hypothetical protein